MPSSSPVIDVHAIIDSRQVGRFQLSVILLCGLVVLLDGLDTQVIGYLAPAVSAEWSIPREDLGYILSAGLVGLMVGLLVISPIADRRGRKSAIVVSVALFGFFTLLTAAAEGPTDLLIYRFLAGVGLGGAMPNVLALTGEYVPKRRRATLVIIMFCGFSLGSIISGVLSAVLISQFGWRSVFLVSGTLPLLLVPVLVMRLPESLHFLAIRSERPEEMRRLLGELAPDLDVPASASFRTEAEAKGVPITQLFQSGRAIGTVLLWVIFFMNLLDFYFLQSWLPTILTDSGFSQEVAALATTLISVGGIVAGILSGTLMDRIGAYNVLAGLYVCGMFAVTLIGVSVSSLPALLVATFGAGFCVSGAQKSVNALSVLFYPTAIRSTGVGWALGIGRTGSIIGPILAGWLIAAGWTTENLFRLAALPMLVAAVVVFTMGRHYRGSKATVPERPVAVPTND